MSKARLTLLSGLFDHMVVQRTDAKSAVLNFSGNSPIAGQLSVSVRKGRSRAQSFQCGQVKAGRFEAKAGRLPVGGPYELTVTVEAGDGRLAVAVVKDVLVGDVWLLGGQSNMQGCGLLASAAKPHPQVRAFFMDDRWAVARDPIHNLWDAVDPVHVAINGGNAIPPATDWGTGPGPAFGQEMFRLTGVPQGLIACAHGGTSMAQWNPLLKKEGGGSLYGAMLRRLRKNGGKAAGVIWYQGESDTGPDQVTVFTRRMGEFIRHLRHDTGDARLPFAMVQIGRLVDRVDPPGKSDWNAIQEQQRKLAGKIPFVAVVPSVDLPLDDAIHISGKGQNILGQRLALAMRQFTKPAGRSTLPAPVSVKIIDNPERTGGGAVRVSFSHLKGNLKSEGRPSGFSLLGAKGLLGADGGEIIYETRLQGRDVLLLSQWPPAILREGLLSYGSGANPYCNIYDAASAWPLPVFGPWPLGKPRLLSEFLKSWRVAWVDADLHPRGALPVIPDKEFQDFQTEGNFADLHARILGVKRGAFLLAGAFRVAEPMRLAASVGYDGPVQVWVDGKKVFEDLKGKPPAWPDEGTGRSFLASRGQHQVRVLLGADGGNSWGVFLRLQRLDVRPAGKEPAMPEWGDVSASASMKF